ncbi:hypothetical protein NBO_498g0004 [Nosema bombycis CQ1]|uniref:Uncharacterized protein n=1 Tax=Nosema bombycis (strain CQ1 / CVCC 102059) TaxID=578461 RepID=R0MDR7_NOSB1|nr:hypothetical protein NBO_498g0004 [Nosema bombycis CQ1]|eukprot:EOB12225.1 hypothetical protein NBO_498g0004 [Nosema bombycis CQ1]
MIHLILTFIDLLLLLCFTSSRKSSIHYDVTDVLNFISDKNYEFSEWALALCFSIYNHTKYFYLCYTCII